MNSHPLRPLYPEVLKLEGLVRHIERLVIPAQWDHVTALQNLHVRKRGPTIACFRMLKQVTRLLWKRRDEPFAFELGVIFLDETGPEFRRYDRLFELVIDTGTMPLPVDAVAAVRHKHDWHTLFYRMWDAEHHYAQFLRHVVVMHPPVARADGKLLFLGFNMNDNSIHAYDAGHDARWVFEKGTAILVDIPLGHSCLKKEKAIDKVHAN